MPGTPAHRLTLRLTRLQVYELASILVGHDSMVAQVEVERHKAPVDQPDDPFVAEGTRPQHLSSGSPTAVLGGAERDGLDHQQPLLLLGLG